MKMKEYYREKFKQWFGECSPEPEQGDYPEDVGEAISTTVEPPTNKSEV